MPASIPVPATNPGAELLAKAEANEAKEDLKAAEATRKGAEDERRQKETADKARQD